MVKAKASVLDLTSLAQLKGIDGYALLDTSGDVIQAKLENNTEIFELRKLVSEMLDQDSPKGIQFQSRIMMTARGLMQIARFEDAYLIIKAGHKEPVNINELTNITNALLEIG
jgi:hypothetical protein